MRKPFLILCCLLLAALAAWFAWPRERGPLPAPPAPQVPQQPDPRPAEPLSGEPRTGPEPVPEGPLRERAPVDRARAHLTGRVQAQGQGPLARASVRAEVELAGEIRASGEGETGADGAYVLGLPGWDQLDALEQESARVLVQARAEGFQPRTLPTRLLASRAADTGPSARVDFTLLPGRALDGRVVDSEGRPVAGAEVALVVESGPPGRAKPVRAVETTSGADGRFELGFASSSTGLLYARAENVGVALRPLVLEAGRDQPLGDLVLEGPGELSGQAQFVDGKPAADLELWAIPEPVANDPAALARSVSERFERELAGGGLFGAQTRTDAQGRFRLRGLAGGRYMLRCPRPELVMEPRTGFYQTTVENIRLSVESYRLRVRALDANGRELRGARVRLTELNEVAAGSYEPGQVWNETVRGPLACASFDVQPEGAYGVRVSAAGFAAREDLVLLAQGEYEQLQEYRLEPAGAPARLRLRLQGALDAPPERAQVELVSPLTGASDPDVGILECDAQGWLPALAPGSYLLSIGFRQDAEHPSWYLPARTKMPLELAPGVERELEIMLEAGARLELELELAGPAPQGFALALPDGLPESELAARRDAHLAQRGAFVDAVNLDTKQRQRLQFWAPAGGLASQLLPGANARAYDLLRPGRWQLEAEAQGFRPATTEIVLVAGRVQRAQLAFVAR